MAAAEPAHHTVVEGLLPAGQVRWRPSCPRMDERRVGVVREHLDLAPAGDVSGGADVIGVEVRQDQPAQVRGLVSGLADCLCDQGGRAGQAGVDEREPPGIVPEVGVPDGKADEVQAWHQLDDVHAATVSGCQTGTPGRSAVGRPAAGSPVSYCTPSRGPSPRVTPGQSPSSRDPCRIFSLSRLACQMVETRADRPLRHSAPPALATGRL